MRTGSRCHGASFIVWSAQWSCDATIGSDSPRLGFEGIEIAATEHPQIGACPEFIRRLSAEMNVEKRKFILGTCEVQYLQVVVFKQHSSGLCGVRQNGV